MACRRRDFALELMTPLARATVAATFFQSVRQPSRSAWGGRRSPGHRGRLPSQYPAASAGASGRSWRVLRLAAWLAIPGIADDPAAPLFRPQRSARKLGHDGFRPKPITTRAVEKLIGRYVEALQARRQRDRAFATRQRRSPPSTSGDRTSSTCRISQGTPIR